ncbi:NAD(P)H-binding protein [Bacillus spongiae]|uniref:NAD(P)H-binding protein n=1 Tax=Bacillus spongiae TaxID=2683610 RepID=A0ABU8HAU5_9BACI
MKICLFGATGRVGSILLDNMVQGGHDVRVLVRNKEKITISSSNLSVIQGNVLDETDIQNTMNQSDIVVSCLGTDQNSTLSKSMPLILKSMRLFNVKRIITIGTAGILQSRSNPGTFRFLTVESKRKKTTAVKDHLKTYFMLKQSNMEWSIVCPTYLPTGQRQGNYRVQKHQLPESSSSISIYDTADFTYSLLTNHDYEYARIGITY